jgi:uncharacterized integral membrane protein
MRVLNVLTWVVRIFLFLFLFIFALMNTEPVKLRFFLSHAWEVPLVFLLLIFFAGGVFLGLLAMTGALFRERRASALLRRELARLNKTDGQTALPVFPDVEP